MATDRPIDTFATITPPGQRPVVTSIFDFSADALAQLRLWLEQNPPAIGISNVLGFSQFTATAAATAADTARTGSTYGTVGGGPALTGLPDGKYVVLWGSSATGSAGVSNAEMAIGVNGATTTPGGDHTMLAYTSSSTYTSIMAADTFTLSAGGNNRLDTIYASSDNTSACHWQNRFIIALRYANK